MNIDQITTFTGLTWGQVIDWLNTQLPNEAYKAVPGGANLTSINPMFLTEALTNCFGPFGIGWGLETASTPEFFNYDERESTKRTYTVWCVGYHHAEFWYMINVDGESRRIEIPTFGYNENEDQGWAFGGARTSCIGNAAKMLLWQLSVYKGEFKPKALNEDADMSKPGLIVIPFGKHKGETLIGLLKNGGRSYIDWLAQKSTDEKVKQAAILIAQLDNMDFSDKSNAWDAVQLAGVNYFGFSDIDTVKAAIKEKFEKATPKQAFNYLMNYEHTTDDNDQ
jgi:hypothetical protein